MHYFRIHPAYWEDRLQRALAMGINTIEASWKGACSVRLPALAGMQGDVQGLRKVWPWAA